MNHEIGFAAGKVWNTLNTEGNVSTERLKRVTRLNDKLLYQAIGWLAREDKLNFEKKGKYLSISLKESF